MDVITTFLGILLGVILSIILPIVIKWVVIKKDKSGGVALYVKTVLMPYIKAAVAAIVISIVILLFAPEGLNSFQAAAMLGFGWEAFIKNLMTKED
jgi:hypothetical protein